MESNLDKPRATAEDIFHYIKEFFDRKKRTVAKFKINFSCKSKSTPHKILAISEQNLMRKYEIPGEDFKESQIKDIAISSYENLQTLQL